MPTTAKTKIGESKEYTSVTVSREIPKDIRTLVKEFGEEIVGSAAAQHLTVQMQAAMRKLLENGKKDEEIEATIASWTPGMKIAAAPKDPQAAFRALWAGMTPEERKDFMAKLEKEAAQG